MIACLQPLGASDAAVSRKREKEMESLAQHCVLVVDDDSSIRLLLVSALRHNGYRTLQARNGREALAEMHGGHPDLVLMDLVMPEMSGWEVLRERTSDPALLRIPVIVLSACNIRQVRADVLEKRVCGVIAKPFDLDNVLTTVTDCLENPHASGRAAA